jgi:hypothetical protein
VVCATEQAASVMTKIRIAKERSFISSLGSIIVFNELELLNQNGNLRFHFDL